MSVATDLESHYTHPALAADVEVSIRSVAREATRLTLDDLADIDEFHMGGRAATTAVLAACTFTPGTKLLDVGSGFGGPARVAAAQTGCHVTGIDLMAAYVDIARDLSQRTGFADNTTFVAGSALSMPFEDASFAGAYMFHVGMNIADKAGLAREVRRVLAPGATFAVYDILRVGEGPLTFPLPWSSVAATSAVAGIDTYRAALTAAGFEISEERDMRPIVRAAPRPTPQVMPHRGPGWPTKVENLTGMVRTGILAPTLLVAKAMP